MTHPARYLPNKAQKPPRGTLLNRSHLLARGLVGCWVMNEGSGNKVFDLSGNRFHGTITGATWVGTAKGIGLDFGTTTDNYYIRFTDARLLNLPLNASGFSAATLLRPTGSVVADQAVLSWTGTDDLVIYPNDGAAGSGGMRVFWRDCGVNLINYAGVDLQNQWVSTVFTAIDNSQAGYENGVSVDTATETLAGAGPFDQFDIGLYGDGTQYISGEVVYVYLWDRVLTPTEIALIHREPYCMF